MTQEDAFGAIENWQAVYFRCEVFTMATTTTAAITAAANSLSMVLAETLVAAGITTPVCDQNVIPSGFQVAVKNAAETIHGACDELGRALEVHYGEEGDGGYAAFAQACRWIADGVEENQRELLAQVCFRVFNVPGAFGWR